MAAKTQGVPSSSEASRLAREHHESTVRRKLHVVLAVDSLASGGAQRQLVDLAVRLHRGTNTRSTVLVYHPQDFFAPKLRAHGVPIVQIPKRLPIDPVLPWRIRRWLTTADVDVVHAFLLNPSLWCALAVRSLRRRPIVVAAERNCLIATNTREAVIQRLVYRISDAVTANAASAAREIHQKLGVPEERIDYLPNGIDLEEWDEAARERSPVEVDPSCFNLALIGGLRPEKAHPVLFEALAGLGPARTRNWRVWCIGGATAGRSVAQRIQQEMEQRRLAEVVRIEPPVRNVAAFMKDLDALVLPSLNEGFPNVVLEAMASRLPVVVTPVGDVPNLVRDGVTGLYAATGDSASLAAALRRMAELSPDERRAMGERGRLEIEARYQMQGVFEAHVTLYERLVAERWGHWSGARRPQE